MLKSLELTNFKSFAGEPQTIPFAPVTIFVGANGSGKSNVFDAIRFLQGFCGRLSIGEVLTGKKEGGRAVFPGIRGGLSEIGWKYEKSFQIKSSHQVIDDLKYHMAYDVATEERYPIATKEDLCPFPVQLLHTVNINLNEGGIIDYESFHRIESDNSLVPTLEAFRNNPECSSPTISLGRRSLTHISEEFFDRTLLRLLLHSGISPYWDISACAEDSITAHFLEMHPSEMQGYVPLNNQELGDHGQNLSAVLNRVCEDSCSTQRLLEWISSLCSPSIVDIEFDETKLGDVLVQLVEEGGQTISARSLSDGTLRFMGLLAALFTVPEGTIILLEEIENGLHPTRIHLLMELLEQFAAERNLQIIATTHSSQVLMGLSESALQDAVLFARDEEHPGTIVKRLGDLDHFDEVTKSARIDELFTTGWLEFAV